MSEPADDARMILAELMRRRDLRSVDVENAVEALLAGRWPEAESAAVLVALRMKGETAEELAAAASVLRRHMVRWEPGQPGILDTCGTGGDDSGTFNISTAAAIVAAGAGAPVVKHGNRAVSSRSGSADVLTELGIPIDAGADAARRSLDLAGLAFCFAPNFHPAMKQIAPLRRRLGIRTLFNLIGPLANPAGAEFQLLGVGKPELLDPMAGAAARLGVSRAVLVSGRDGLDEITLGAPTDVRIVEFGQVRAEVWTAELFGLEPCSGKELSAATPADSARIIREILAGIAGPAQRIVLANAAAALWCAGRAEDLMSGVQWAREAVESGKARRVLESMQRAAAKP